MTHDEMILWARSSVWAAGCLTFGRAAELHVLIALSLIATWSYYVTTVRPQRAWALLLIGLSAGWAVKQMIGGVSYWN